MSKAQIRGKGHHKTQMGPSKHENKAREDAFIYNLGVLIGCVAEIQTTTGEKYEGVLSAFNHQSLKIMIEAAHEPTDDDESTITNHYDLIIVPPEKIAVLKFKNAEVSYATRDFETDTAISGARKINFGDKELTPWDGAEDFIDGGLELEGGQNGWGAEDMFKKNEEKYGVRTSYTDELLGYTTQIDKNSDIYRKQEQEALLVAQEIEGNTDSRARVNAENGGEDEEDAFSAVQRPGRNNNNNTQQSAQSSSAAGGSDKYVPPFRLQMHQPSQSHRGNANGPPQINNPIRKQPYGSSGGSNHKERYVQVSNPSYQDGRLTHERARRPPPQNQPHTYVHGTQDVRVRRDEENPRQPRVGQKVPAERRDRDINKIQQKNRDFSTNFTLTDQGQGHHVRMRGVPHPAQNSGPVHGPPPMVSADPGQRHPPTNEFRSMQMSSNQTPPKPPKKDEYSPVPPLIPGPASTNSENSSSASGTDSPRSTTTNSISANSSSPSPSVSAALVNTTPSTENTSLTSVSVAESSSSTSVSSGGGDPKSADPDKKKPFAFNVNAKEFNPNAKPFQPRSPSTPPRPPSTPASAQQQVLTGPMQQMVPSSYVQHQQLVYQPYPPHAQATMVSAANSGVTSGGTTPRQRHPKSIMHVQQQQRPDMTPPLQMAGPPLAIQPTSSQPPYFVQQATSGYPTATHVVRVPQHVLPAVYSTDGNSGAHVTHLQYIHHNGAQANAGHQAANQHQSNAIAQQPTVQANGHGYSQVTNAHGHHQVVYQMGGQMVPMVSVPYGHNAQTLHLMPYIPQQGGNSAGIPHSQ